MKGNPPNDTLPNEQLRCCSMFLRWHRDTGVSHWHHYDCLCV